MITTERLNIFLYDRLTDYLRIKVNCYEWERPLNDTKEAVVINTPYLTSNYLPQRGYSNINIYVPFRLVRQGGKVIPMQDTARLGEIANSVMRVLENHCSFEGFVYEVEAQAQGLLHDIKQSYLSIRINWNIQKEF